MYNWKENFEKIHKPNFRFHRKSVLQLFVDMNCFYELFTPHANHKLNSYGGISKKHWLSM